MPEPDRSRDQDIKILEAVDRITRSGVLGTGDRMPALLGYLVREELAGRGDRIKSFSIATEVLGRGRDFDPQSDSIARAEMTRLRKAIDHYNATVGQSDDVLITIPKGSYRPAISARGAAAAGEPSARQAVLTGASRPPAKSAWMLLALAAVGLAALIAALKLDAPRPANRALSPPLLVMQPSAQAGSRIGGLADGIQGEVAAELARQPWLTVIQPQNLAQIDAQLATASASRAIYLLELQVSELGGGYRITAFLKRWPDHAVSWTGSRDGLSLSQQSGHVLREVAARLSRDLAEPGGAISLAEVARIDGDARHDQRFTCLMAMRRYWRSYDPALRSEAENCLTEALRNDPDFVSGRAAMALLQIESARREEGRERDRLLKEARNYLAGAGSDSILTGVARMALTACSGDPATLREVADRMIAAYPNNPDVLADAGSKLGLALGDWPTALELEARAMALNPAADPWYPLATFVKSLLDGQLSRAMELLSAAPQRNFGPGQVIRLALGGLTGDASLIADASARLRELGIPDARAARAVIDGQCWRDEAKSVVMRGIAAAMR